jgi:hypothetical protein
MACFKNPWFSSPKKPIHYKDYLKYDYLFQKQMIMEQNRLPRSPHPLNIPANRVNNLILLIDDAEDHPSKSQNSCNTQIYYEWHSIAVPLELHESLELSWRAIKIKYSIPDGYLHCNPQRHQLLDPDVTLRSEIFDLIMDSQIKHFISRISREASEFGYKDMSTDSFYQEKLRKNWNFKRPKEQALFWHLILVDHSIGQEYPGKKAFAFCDRTEGSNSKFNSGTRQDDGWGTFDHVSLKNINNSIAFRVHETPRDLIGNLLDLPDYLAWIFRRCQLKLDVRDFEEGSEPLTDDEWNKRVSKLRPAEQEFSKQFETLITEGRTMYLHHT